VKLCLTGTHSHKALAVRSTVHHRYDAGGRLTGSPRQNSRASAYREVPQSKNLYTIKRSSEEVSVLLRTFERRKTAASAAVSCSLRNLNPPRKKER
jgi:hypothetical protein